MDETVVINPLTNRPIKVGENPIETPKILKFWCTVCNIELNNPGPTIQHFRGKSHATKLQQENSAYRKAAPMKRQIQQAGRPAINPEPVPKKPFIEIPASNINKDLICNDCGVIFNSEKSAQQHYSGKKHATAVAANAIASTSSSKSSVTIQKVSKHFSCSTCDVTLTSQIQLQQHFNGVRHKLKSGAIKEPPDWWKEQQDTFNRVKPNSQAPMQAPMQNTDAEAFRCELCQIIVNSQLQLGQHLNSHRHKEKETREKSCGKFSNKAPFNRQHYNNGKKRLRNPPGHNNPNHLPLGGSGYRNGGFF